MDHVFTVDIGCAIPTLVSRYVSKQSKTLCYGRNTSEGVVPRCTVYYIAVQLQLSREYSVQGEFYWLFCSGAVFPGAMCLFS